MCFHYNKKMDLNSEEEERFNDFIDSYKWRVSDYIIERNQNIIANFECANLSGENLRNILRRARQVAFKRFGNERFSCLVSIGRYLSKYSTEGVLTFRLFTSGLNTLLNESHVSFPTTVKTFFEDCRKKCRFDEVFLSQSFFADQDSAYNFVRLANIEFIFFQI